MFSNTSVPLMNSSHLLHGKPLVEDAEALTDVNWSRGEITAFKRQRHIRNPKSDFVIAGCSKVEFEENSAFFMIHPV